MTEREQKDKFLEDKFENLLKLTRSDKVAVLCRLIATFEHNFIYSPDSSFTPLQILNLIYEDVENIALETKSEADQN